MRESTFVKLGLACFGLILGSFLVRGTTRIVVGDRTAVLLAAPLGLAALGLLLVLLVVSVLAVTGIRPLEDGET